MVTTSEQSNLAAREQIIPHLSQWYGEDVLQTTNRNGNESYSGKQNCIWEFDPLNSRVTDW